MTTDILCNIDFNNIILIVTDPTLHRHKPVFRYYKFFIIVVVVHRCVHTFRTRHHF